MYKFSVNESIKGAYKSVITESTYGDSLTNKEQWLEVFDKIGKIPDEERMFEKTKNDFGAVTEAENWIQSMDYSIGSMQSDNPRAIAKGNLNIAKWWNINKEEYPRIDGLMLSNDYRNGNVLVILFKDKGELGKTEENEEESEEILDQNTDKNSEEVEDRNAAFPKEEDEEEIDFSNIQLPESFSNSIKLIENNEKLG